MVRLQTVIGRERFDGSSGKGTGKLVLWLGVVSLE